MGTDMAAYWRGELLYGDDFSEAQIAEWFEAEREGYANLGAAEHGTAGNYGYHQLNIRHGFRHLPGGRLENALGLGSSYGGEFLPIIDRLDAITVLEPSSSLRTNALDGVPLNYVKPTPTGHMPFPDKSFDLALSLGTLHHIPNVSLVVRELGRVLRSGGHALIREPVTSMGDWTKPRPGLTARERGIPRPVFRKAFAEAGLTVVRDTPCMFPTTRRASHYGYGFNSASGVVLDEALSRAMAWNGRYHATAAWHKIRPIARFYVLRKTQG